jgi:hypothetical protein
MFVKSDGGFDCDVYDVDVMDFDENFTVVYGEVSGLVSSLSARFDMHEDDIKVSKSGHTLSVEFEGFNVSWDSVAYRDLTDDDLLT